MQQVPWDHFDHCISVRGRAAFPPWLGRFAEQKALNDVRHAGHQVTTTRLTGCPREVFIQSKFDYWVVPTRRVAMDRGTALHSVAADSFNPEVWYTEGNDKMRMNMQARFFVGTPYEIELDLLADAIRRDLTEIVDLKFPKDWSLRWRKGDKGWAKDEHRIQLNLIRLALAQQEWAIKDGYDKDEVRLTIWDHAIGDGDEGPEPMVADPHGGLIKVPYLEEEDILRHRPWGGQWTVGDVITVYKAIEDAVAEGGTDEEVAAAIPLVGEGMFNGKKCEKMCDVSRICGKLTRVYGRPGEEVQSGVVGED
jgi:hypothetical protein